MNFSTLVVILVILCLQQLVAGGKRKTLTVGDGWEKCLTEGQKNYYFGVVQSNLNKYDKYSDIGEGITDQIKKENNGAEVNVLIAKKGSASVWSKCTITFFYGKRFIFLF